MALKELCPPIVDKVLRENIKSVLPNVIAQTKEIDFAKVDLILQNDWKLGKNLSYYVAFSTLLNLDAYPNAGFHRPIKKVLVAQMQERIFEIDDFDVWKHLFLGGGRCSIRFYLHFLFGFIDEKKIAI